MFKWSVVRDTLAELASIKGSKDKMAYIKTIPSEVLEQMKDVIKYALDDMLKYNVTKVDAPKPKGLFSMSSDSKSKTYEMEDFFEFLNYLDLKGSANNDDKAKLADIVYGMAEYERELAEMIIQRTLRNGVGLSTWRKVYGPDFCPPFEYALMGAYNEKKILENINFDKGALSQLKSDGARCIICCRDGVVVARSRNGKPIDGIESILKFVVDNFPTEQDFDLDGELVVLDLDGKILPRTTGNGIIAKAAKGTIAPHEERRIRLVAWDIIFRDDLPQGYKLRLDDLRAIVGAIDTSNNRILITETRLVYSLAEAKLHYKELVQRGEEGTVLKDPDSLWTPGDSDGCRDANGFKFKEEHPGDFVITGWYFGKKGSKYEKFIGGLECRSSCGQVVFNVGSGLTDKMRMVDDPDAYVGKVVECLYNGRTMAEGSEVWSLFLPRVVEIRDDKTDGDTLEKLIQQEEASRELAA